MALTKRQKWLTGILSFVALVALAVYLFEWNMLRGFVERRVTAATGREFHINGDLDVKLSWRPLIIVNDVSFANAQWSETPLMAQLQRAEVILDLRSVFRPEVTLPLVRLTQPVLVLEKNDAGMANWLFDNQQPDKKANGKTIDLQDLQINQGRITYRSPIEKADVTVDLSSIEDQGMRRLQVQAKGKYLDLDTEAQGEVGAISSLADLEGRYPIQLAGHVGKTRMQAQGVVIKPLQLEGLDMKFELSGGSLADLFPLIGVPLPATEPYSVSGKLTQSASLWDLPQFAGKIGNSELHGQFSVDRGAQPQFIKANLQSDNLDLKDLSGFIGAREESGEKIVDPNKVLPNSPFSFDKLYAANADVQFKGKRIQNERLPIDDMTAHLKLDDGHLTLDPLNFGVADGDIRSTISLNAKQSPIVTEADIQLRKIRIDQLFPGFKFQKANAGVIGGRAKFASQGDSIAKMLGSANGQIAFMMNGGSVSQLVVRLANLDVANSVIVLLGGDKSIPIRCMVTDLAAKDGDMQVNTMVLDTSKAVVNGNGHINFKDETLDLRLTSDPKGISLVALRGPIEYQGHFQKSQGRSVTEKCFRPRSRRSGIGFSVRATGIHSLDRLRGRRGQRLHCLDQRSRSARQAAGTGQGHANQAHSSSKINELRRNAFCQPPADHEFLIYSLQTLIALSGAEVAMWQGALP
ncbi:MAG: AsmA family protein [Steroidobacteraceae bacterium]